ncbi:MAG: VOC family protein [Bacteroidetes bacterium]|nr:VOC family protein [Bacteroidota bacterium]
MATAIPIFRIFDFEKVKEFYCEWLGFAIDWENRNSGNPVYMQVSLQGIIIHLSEHYGDCSPGARIHVEDFKGLREYHRTLISKNYKFMKPGIETFSFNDKCWCMEVIDPFSNRITFTGPK